MLSVRAVITKVITLSPTITALCKKLGSRHFGKFEYKQDKIDPKLGFAPPGAR